MCADIIDINKTIEDLEKDGLQIVSQHIFKYYIRNFNIQTFLLNYCSFFLKNGKFIPGTTSSDLIALYNFDKNLGNHIFRDILILEKIINTNVVYATINYFKIKDKKLFNLPKDFIIKNILVNVNNIKPPLAADALMYKMTKFLDANSELRNYIDKSIKDPIIRWHNIPLDKMCLSWSFATTFSFFIALPETVKQLMLTQFDIPPMQFIGFTNLIENIINIRNLISHNIVVYNATIKYQSKALNDFYNFLFQQEIKTFALPHLIKCIGKLVNNEKLYIKTIDGINKTEISEQHKQMILKLFII